MKTCGTAIGAVLWQRWRAEDFSYVLRYRRLRIERGTIYLLH